MRAVTRERILSLTRHVMTMGGGATAGVSVVPGDPFMLGMPLSAWGGIVVATAGCVNAWYSKPESRDARPDPG